MKIASEITSEDSLMSLGMELDFEPNEIEAIKVDRCHRGIKMQAFQVIYRWDLRHACPVQEKRCKLRAALVQIGKAAVIQKHCL